MALNSRFSLHQNKAEFWDIEDPKDMSDKGYEKIISQIKSRIKHLIKDIPWWDLPSNII